MSKVVATRTEMVDGNEYVVKTSHQLIRNVTEAAMVLSNENVTEGPCRKKSG